MTEKTKILYTKTDEAPALATYSFLPIVQSFCAASDIEIEKRDISLVARILSQFDDLLEPGQRVSDDLAYLGELVKKPQANIIKLPNISASLPQLQAAVKELQEKGYPLPVYPSEPTTQKDMEIKSRYDRVLGSAVNPVLRQGNSDRRAPVSVKQFARKNPHSMGAWSPDSKSHVASMVEGDFFGNEKSTTIEKDGYLRVEFLTEDGDIQTLKDDVPILAGDVVDAAVMSASRLEAFFEKEIEAAKDEGVLFSLHLKATMMKVSDPIIFGHAVRVFYRDVFVKHEGLFEKLGVAPNNGIGDVYKKIAVLPVETRKEIENDIQVVYKNRPGLAMVNSDKGITNLHVPSDVIIDASMPAAIRTSGQMWNAEGHLQDMKAVIPDRSYSGVYQAAIDFCKEHGAFDPVTMGTVQNVGLMAQKAEEYGSHDKTFEIESHGVIRVVDEKGHILFEHTVGKGDIWRMCQVKDAAIADWVKLGVSRARITGYPAVFWLDKKRPHDAQLLAKVDKLLKTHDTEGLDIHILAPREATQFSLMRMKEGQNTISVTGNVLRDYLTDLFPILELGTSAKMLSIVQLMAGGGLFETGAGGSAPKHVQQFEQENHLRWDSLGEFLALAASLEHLSNSYGIKKAKILADALDRATATFLQNNHSPSRNVGEIDTRGSHFYLTLYWAKELAKQSVDVELQSVFGRMSMYLSNNERKILHELSAVQGKAVNMGGYYKPDDDMGFAAMRPSSTFNMALDLIL